MKTPSGGGRPECARRRLGPSADRFLTLTRALLSQPTKRHNERGNETVTPHRCRSVQRTRLGCACTPRSADETDGFGQRCAGGRNARRHCLPGRPGGARTHPRRNTPSRARRERRERAAERVILALRESFLRCAAARGRRADERESTTVLAASGRESTRSDDDARERSHTHAKKTHSSPKRKRKTTGATSTSRACLTGRRSRASGWRSRAAAAG